MIVVLGHVAKQSRSRINIVQHHIDVAVVEDVSKRCASCRNYYRQSASCGRRDFLKFLSVQVAKQQRPLRIGRSPPGFVGNGINVAVRYEKIQQAVIVKIQKTCSPVQEWNDGISYSAPERHIAKKPVAIISIERFVVVGKRRDK